MAVPLSVVAINAELPPGEQRVWATQALMRSGDKEVEQSMLDRSSKGPCHQ